MQDLQQQIEQYLLSCRYQKGLNIKTLKAYRIDLQQFAAFTKSNQLELKREHILQYISNLQETYRSRTVRRKIASVKAFCNYLEYEQIIVESPFTRLRLKLNAPLILPRTIPLSAIEAVLAAAYRQKTSDQSEQQRKISLRDIAVLELLFATGIRVSELCSLKPDDIRLDEGEIKIYGKGAKERFVQLTNPAVIQVIDDYQQANETAIRQSNAFFVNRLQRPLTDQSVRGIIRKYERLAEVNLHITPHMFRHSFATLLLEADVDIRYIQGLLGHSSVVTTQIYTHIAGKKQRDILSTKHPRNQMRF